MTTTIFISFWSILTPSRTSPWLTPPLPRHPTFFYSHPSNPICAPLYSWRHGLPMKVAWLTRAYTPRKNWLLLSQSYRLPVIPSYVWAGFCLQSPSLPSWGWDLIFKVVIFGHRSNLNRCRYCEVNWLLGVYVVWRCYKTSISNTPFT